MSSLKEKVLTSAIAIYVIRLFGTGINFITSIVLARLLIPESFGVFALALVVVSIATVLLDLGVSDLAVREKKVYYGNIWLFKVFLSFIIILFTLLTAEKFSFLSPGVPKILRVLILCLIPPRINISRRDLSL